MMLIRSSLFNLWFYLGTAAFAIGSVLPRPFARFLSPDWAVRYAACWARFVLLALHPLCGVRWQVLGREHLPTDGAALIVSMHQSAFDTMIWFQLVKLPSYVLKLELTRIPLFGSMLGHVGTIAVDREAGGAAIRALLKGSDEAVADRRQIVIFPEGTRVAPGQAAALHPGFAAIAARTKLPIIPVTTDSGRYWGRRAFRKHPGTIRIWVHPPLPAGLSRPEMSERLEAIFAAARAEAGIQANGARA
jgi:1-acyl-sn-glycerol-3-phosphate acyltransferase